jgi:hypothetical protein
VPSDCVDPNPNVLFDSDNWTCTGGACEYTGCVGNAECDAAYGPGYACVMHQSYPLPACVEACSTAADCVSPAGPLFDQDNYACEAGGCRWLGCNSADECRQTFQDQTYVCEPQAGLSFNNCIRPCSAAADCSASSTSPAFDADNYACTNARCEYLGCNNAQECQASFTMGLWDCR